LKRRELILAVGGAAIAWPLAARAQQGERMRRIGVVMGLPASDPGGRSEFAALKQGLEDLGWIDGRNFEIKARWGGEPDRVQASAKELVGLPCEVIIARSTPVTAAVLKETRTIPVVFAIVVDPVGSGFVQSVARPGGNVTGFQNYEFTMVGKWLQMLEEIAPHVRRNAYIYNPTTAPPGFLRALDTVAPSVSVQLVATPVQSSAEIDVAFAELVRERGAGLMMVPDIFNTANHTQIIALAAKHGLPAMYPHRFNDALVTYGPDTPDLFRRAASYVDRILRGEKTGELPVQAPIKYELIINLKVAKALGLEVPPTLLARADEVIE